MHPNRVLYDVLYSALCPPIKVTGARGGEGGGLEPRVPGRVHPTEVVHTGGCPHQLGSLVLLGVDGGQSIEPVIRLYCQLVRYYGRNV